MIREGRMAMTARLMVVDFPKKNCLKGGKEDEQSFGKDQEFGDGANGRSGYQFDG